MTVAFVTFCHPPKYVEKLHRPGVLRAMVESHGWPFDDVLVVHQRCRAQDYQPFDFPCRTVDLPESEFNALFTRFGVDPINPRADELTHGPQASHFWRWHVGNHLCGLENTDAEFIVFADCDTHIKSQPEGQSWVGVGIGILRNRPDVLIVGPGDGGSGGGGMGEGGYWEDRTRLTRNVSQQLFICRGDEFRRKVKFDVPWNGQFDAPGGPFQEYYFLLEGRLNRYMDTTGQWRAVLPDQFRYWHNSYWGND